MKIVKLLFLVSIFSICYILPTNLLGQVPGWTQKESMPTQVVRKYVREGGSLTSVDDVIFAFRGYRSSEFYKYDIALDTWILKCSIPYGVNPSNPMQINRKKINEGASLCWDGVNTIYATKGGGTSEFWAYDIYGDTWTAKAFVPSERGLRGGTSLAYFNGKIYLLAGEQSEYAQTNFFRYDIVNDIWSHLWPAPLIPDGKPFRDGSCIVQLGSKIYALKGSGEHNYFWAYDVSAGVWAQMETIPLVHLGNPTGDISENEMEISVTDDGDLRYRRTKVRDGGAMTSGTGVIYAIKGGGSKEFWEYRYSYGEWWWIPLETIPRLNRQSVPKHGAGLTYTNGMVYLLKGNNTPEFWQYTPTEAMSNVKIQNSKPNLLSGVMAQPTSGVDRFILFQNFPNPFNALTAIRYSLPAESKVSLLIYDVSGKLVKILVNEKMKPGAYTTIWNGTNDQDKKVVAGVYFYTLKTNCQTAQKKMLMLR